MKPRIPRDRGRSLKTCAAASAIMSQGFDYDVYLAYSSEDKAVVLALAERLRKDGLRVWACNLGGPDAADRVGEPTPKGARCTRECADTRESIPRATSCTPYS